MIRMLCHYQYTTGVPYLQQAKYNDGQIHIAKWVRNALDLNDGDELLFEVVDNKIIFTKAEG